MEAGVSALVVSRRPGLIGSGGNGRVAVLLGHGRALPHHRADVVDDGEREPSRVMELGAAGHPARSCAGPIGQRSCRQSIWVIWPADRRTAVCSAVPVTDTS